MRLRGRRVERNIIRREQVERFTFQSGDLSSYLILPHPKQFLIHLGLGLESLVNDQALRNRLGTHLRVRAPAVAVRGGEGQVSIRLTDGSHEEFDRAVLAVPAPSAARLVSDANPELAKLLDEFVQASVAVVHLGYPRAQVDHPLDGFGFLVARGEGSGGVLAVLAMEQTGRALDGEPRAIDVSHGAIETRSDAGLRATTSALKAGGGRRVMARSTN